MVIVILIVLLFSPKPNTYGGENLSGKDANETIDKYFNSVAKYGKMKIEKDDESTPETGEFWFDGNNFRIDYFNANGEKRIGIISKDSFAYFCRPEASICEKSVAPVEYYQAFFKKPEYESLNESEDKDDNCTRYFYKINKTYKISGASNDWYNESIVYCTNEKGVQYVELKGGVPNDEGKVETMLTSKYYFTETRVGVSLPGEVFQLPYSIKQD